ncbi:MAG: MATE family efflux transporter [bacterium]
MRVIDRPLTKRVLLLAYPAMVSMLSHTLLSLVDTAMVGRLGAESLAAVGIGAMVMYVVMSGFFAIDSGSRAIVARYFGAGKFSNCGQIFQQALILSVLFGAAITAAGCFFSEDMYRLIRAEPGVTSLGGEYLRLRLFGAAFIFAAFAFNGLFTGLGDTKTPMVVMVVANSLNVALNYTLIFGKLGFPAMGVKGAALATVIARVSGFSIYLAVTLSKKSLRRFSPYGSFSLHRERMKQLIRVASPTSFEQVLEAAGFLAFTVIVTQLGTVPLAAHNIGLNITMLSFMPAFGFGVAASTLVGQSLGAKRFGEAEHSGWTAATLGVLFMSFMGLVFFFLPKYLMMIFTNDREVIRQGVTILKILAFFQPFDGLGMILGLALRGAADTRWVMACNLAITWLLFVPGSYLLALPLGFRLNGSWWALGLLLFASGTAMAWRFRNGKWKKIKI